MYTSHAKQILLIGTANVGKSTLFNQLTKQKHAIAYDRPGVTRDCQQAFIAADSPGKGIILVDTPGFFPKKNAETLHGDNPTAILIQQHISELIAGACCALLVIDVNIGIQSEDLHWARECYRHNLPICLIINKCDGEHEHSATTHYPVDCMMQVQISAKNGRGCKKLREYLLSHYSQHDIPELQNQDNGRIEIALIGKPNVGKSTLTNLLTQRKSMLTSAKAGTTRDSVRHSFAMYEKNFTISDTAGIRRRNQIKDPVEKESINQGFDLIHGAIDLVLLLFSALEPISDQDFRLLRRIISARRRVLVVFNKFDLVAPSKRVALKQQLNYEMRMYPFLDTVFISAQQKKYRSILVKAMLGSTACDTQLSTSKLTALLHQAIAIHPPPMVAGKRIKLKFAHSMPRTRATICITGNRLKQCPQHYQQYLRKFFQSKLNIRGIMVELVLKQSDNPYG